MPNSYNARLIDRISKNMQSVSATEIARERASNKLAGRAAIARGSSLKEVQKNSPFLERVFGGGATLAGAQDQYVDQGVNSYVTSINENMASLREVPPHEFDVRQGKLLSAQMTGDPEIDARLELAAQESVSAATALHNKSHLAYVQEEELKGFHSTLTSALGRVQSTKGAGGDEDDLKLAYKSVIKASTRPSRMNPEAHKEALLGFAELRASAGDPTFGNMLKSMDLDLTPGEQLQQLDNRTTAWKKYRERENVQMDNDLVAIDRYVDSPKSTDAGITQAVIAFEQKYGPGSSGNRMIEWKLRKAKASSDELSKTEMLNRYRLHHSTNEGNGLSTTETQEMAQLNRLYLEEEFKLGHVTREEVEQDVANHWQRDGIMPTKQRQRWNISANQVLSNGQPTQGFLELVREYPRYAKLDVLQANAMIKDGVARQRLLNVVAEVADGMSPEQAAVLWADPERTKMAERTINEPEVREVITDLTKKAFDGSTVPEWMNPMYRESAKNSSLVRGLFEVSARRILAKGGEVSKLEDAAWADVTSRTENFNGEWVPNNGTPMNVSMGTTDSGTKVLNAYIAEYGDEIFPDYLPENISIQLDNTQGTVTFFYKDESGMVTAPQGSKFGIPVPLSRMGDLYKEDLKIKADKKIVDNASAEREHLISARADYLKRESSYVGGEKTDEDYRAEAIEDIDTEGAVRELTRHAATYIQETIGDNYPQIKSMLLNEIPREVQPGMTINQ